MSVSRHFRPILALAVLSAMAAPAFGQTTAPAADPHAHHAMPGAAAQSPEDSPATEAFRAASAAMHQTMDIPYTGNPDVDFITGMIPHHQGAVDAARIVLQYGTDPEVRQFAESVISAQQAEITWMTDWLAKNAN